MKYYYKILVNNLLLTPRNYTEEHHLILCKDRSKHNKNKKEIDNSKLGFLFHIWWAASTSKANTIYINTDEIIRNFFTFYSREIIEFTPDEIQYNRIVRRFSLSYIDNMIVFICRDKTIVSCIGLVHSSRCHLCLHDTLLLNPVSYMPLVLWSLSPAHGTDEARMNIVIIMSLFSDKILK